MAKFSDTIDLYDDQGKLLKSGVGLDKISPLVNPGILKLIGLTKRTVAINLGGAEAALKTGAIGKGNFIKGRELNLDLVANAAAIKEKVMKMVEVVPGDTEIKDFGGKLLLVTVPEARIAAAATYDAAITSVAAAATYAVIDHFKVDMFDGSMVKAAFWGTYPQTMDMVGSNCVSILSIPQNNEGLGYALRNTPGKTTPL